MSFIQSTTLYIIGVCLIYTTCGQQGTELQAIRAVSSSLNNFGLHLLVQTNEEVGDAINLAISPYTVWSLLSIITEGARNNTEHQLETVLNIPSSNNRDQFRRSYRSLTKLLTQNTDGAQLELSSAIFTTQEQNLSRSYQSLIKSFYGVDVMPTDFTNLVQAVNMINSYISDQTHNRINNFVTLDDVVEAQILLTSTLYFKGQWKFPFNKSETFPDKFLDERGNSIDVEMMHQTGVFSYTMVPNIKAHALELPYGKGGRLSMIVVLPRKNEYLSNVLRQLAVLKMEAVFDALSQAEQDFADEDVEVFLPQFNINTELILNMVLHKMGIQDVFNSVDANLLGIFPHYLYLSRVLQQAKIEVNEEGTTATSVAGGAFAYKSPPPKFYANRPFAYFIVDKQTRSVIFAGKLSNPATICNGCLTNN